MSTRDRRTDGTDPAAVEARISAELSDIRERLEAANQAGRKPRLGSAAGIPLAAPQRYVIKAAGRPRRGGGGVTIL